MRLFPDRFSTTCLLATVFLLSPCNSMAQVIYSQNFDSGAPGDSLSSPQFGFIDESSPGAGNMALGAAQHGWSGNSVIGASAAAGTLNNEFLPLALPTHGLLEFSADLYSYGADHSGVGIAFFHDQEAAADHSDFILVSEENQGNWESSTEPAPRNLWDSPVGMHDEVVHAALYWNQDTGENWATLTDGAQTWSSPHSVYAGGVLMNGIDLEIDRRFSSVGGDIDNLEVRVVPGPTPEPITSALGIAGVALFLRRRLSV